MIKNLKDIAEIDLDYMKTHSVTVTEKLDLIYFKVLISEEQINVVTAKNKPITKIDCIVNSVYKDIMDYVDRIIVWKKTSILNTLGPCEVGLFYSPVEKTCTISYPNIHNNFIVGNLYTKDKSLNNIENLLNIIPGLVSLTPICIKDDVSDIDINKTNLELAEYLTGGKTWSGNNINDIEGLIVSCGRKQYQIIINDTTPHLEKIAKKLCRDTLLENFCNVVLTNKDCINILESKRDYVDKVCTLFLEFINSTDIFGKLYVDAEDLLPPNVGYIGDIDYSSLTPTASLICKGNETYKNILRILLVTFNRSVFENKFKNFNDSTRAKLTQILIKINS